MKISDLLPPRHCRLNRTPPRISRALFSERVPHVKKSRAIFSAALLAIIAAALLCASCSPRVRRTEIFIKDVRYVAEIADTPPLREKGLSGRRHLPARRGMLFVFNDESERAFWMKNTRVALDIIWISAGKKVVHISENNTPWPTGDPPVIIPKVKAKYVLELPGGSAAAMKLRAGDLVTFGSETK